MRTQDGVLRLGYLAGIVAAGGVALALLLVSVLVGGVEHWNGAFAVSLGFWTAFIALSEASPLPLPGSRACASLTAAVELAAIPVFGPVGACLAGLTGRIAAHAIQRTGTFLAFWTDLAGAALAVSAAGLEFLVLGGPAGGGWSPGPGRLAPMLGAAAVYFVMRNILHFLAGTILEGRSIPHLWRTRTSRHLLHELLLVPFAFLLAVTQVQHGRVALSFLFLSLLVAHYAYRNWRSTRSAHLSTVRALMAAMDAADPFARGHAWRVSQMSLRIARRLGVPRSDWEEIEYGALLHDIGRTAIENDVMLKPGRLSRGEREMMQTHPHIGYEMLKGLELIEGAAELVHSHHEQPDGRGYPRGLAGEEIPVGARIIMVAAAFEAMTVDRPYRRGLSPEAACEELRRHAGTQFFPEVVNALVELQAAGRLLDFEVHESFLEACRTGDPAASPPVPREMKAALQAPGEGSIEVPEDLALRMEGEERRAV